MAVDKAISFYTLMQYPPFKKAVQENDEKSFKEIIFQAGIEVGADYEIVECEHRPHPDKPFKWFGPRVEGIERQDDDWLKSELCSWENKVSACPDADLRKELRQMGAQTSITGGQLEEMRKNKSTVE